VKSPSPSTPGSVTAFSPVSSPVFSPSFSPIAPPAEPSPPGAAPGASSGGAMVSEGAVSEGAVSEGASTPAGCSGASGSAAGTVAAGGGAVLRGDASAPPTVAGLGAGDSELQAAPNSTTPSELRQAKRIIFFVLNLVR
jgi:hypothetical protein